MAGAVILLLILFSRKIRQVLERVSPLRFLRAKRAYSESSLLTDLPSALFDLAETRTGAIIVLAREDNLKEFLHAGQPLMAIPTVALSRAFSMSMPRPTMGRGD
jgi:DNA integrity scanning protein DisA with diadenylate cyclase activity